MGIQDDARMSFSMWGGTLLAFRIPFRNNWNTCTSLQLSATCPEQPSAVGLAAIPAFRGPFHAFVEAPRAVQWTADRCARLELRNQPCTELCSQLCSRLSIASCAAPARLPTRKIC